jgi:hypothetical protein
MHKLTGESIGQLNNAPVQSVTFLCFIPTVDERRVKSPAIQNPAAVRTTCQSSVTTQLAFSNVEHKPRPRRLSRYIQMRAGPSQTGGALIPTGTPRWLQSLLNDDLHTGRNIGAKFAFMCENIDGRSSDVVEESTLTPPKVASASSRIKEEMSPAKLIVVDGE